MALITHLTPPPQQTITKSSKQKQNQMPQETPSPSVPEKVGRSGQREKACSFIILEKKKRKKKKTKQKKGLHLVSHAVGGNGDEGVPFGFHEGHFSSTAPQ